MARKPVKKPIVIDTDSAMFAATCPKCGEAISTQATVETFNEPPKWAFWGRSGERWRRCEGESGGYRFIHFRTLINGQFSERIAWLRPTTDPANATQEELL